MHKHINKVIMFCAVSTAIGNLPAYCQNTDQNWQWQQQNGQVPGFEGESAGPNQQYGGNQQPYLQPQQPRYSYQSGQYPQQEGGQYYAQPQQRYYGAASQNLLPPGQPGYVQELDNRYSPQDYDERDRSPGERRKKEKRPKDYTMLKNIIGTIGRTVTTSANIAAPVVSTYLMSRAISKTASRPIYQYGYPYSPYRAPYGYGYGVPVPQFGF